MPLPGAAQHLTVAAVRRWLAAWRALLCCCCVGRHAPLSCRSIDLLPPKRTASWLYLALMMLAQMGMLLAAYSPAIMFCELPADAAADAALLRVVKFLWGCGFLVAAFACNSLKTAADRGHLARPANRCAVRSALPASPQLLVWCELLLLPAGCSAGSSTWHWDCCKPARRWCSCRACTRARWRRAAGRPGRSWRRRRQAQRSAAAWRCQAQQAAQLQRWWKWSRRQRRRSALQSGRQSSGATPALGRRCQAQRWC